MFYLILKTYVALIDWIFGYLTTLSNGRIIVNKRRDVKGLF
jgi:hypothetical protein